MIKYINLSLGKTRYQTSLKSSLDVGTKLKYIFMRKKSIY